MIPAENLKNKSTGRKPLGSTKQAELKEMQCLLSTYLLNDRTKSWLCFSCRYYNSHPSCLKTKAEGSSPPCPKSILKYKYLAITSPPHTWSPVTARTSPNGNLSSTHHIFQILEHSRQNVFQKQGSSRGKLFPRSRAPFCKWSPLLTQPKFCIRVYLLQIPLG